MNSLCDSLVREHEIIEQVLDALEAEARKVADGKKVNAPFFREAIDFVRNFADGIHHQKEEQVLFPALCSAGMPKDAGPVGVMLHEHDKGREHIRAMETALEAASEGDAAALSLLVQEALGYVELLRAHIQKENVILFPMAERVLNPGQQELVKAGFRTAETEARNQVARHQDWATKLSC